MKDGHSAKTMSSVIILIHTVATTDPLVLSFLVKRAHLDLLRPGRFNSFFVSPFVKVKAHRRVFHTYSAERDKLVLPGVDELVIGPISPHVSRAVDQPGGVQHQGVPQHCRDEVGYPQGLAPQVPRHRHGDKEAHEEHGRLVVPDEEEERADRRELSVQNKRYLFVMQSFCLAASSA